MANNITVNWKQVDAMVLNSNNVGLATATYTNVFDSTKNRSILNFGAVQAGKVTNLKCVVAEFSDASTVSDIQFWLDSTSSNATGSQNTDLSGSAWNFYYCIVPKANLNFKVQDTFTENQKIGATVNGVTYYLDKSDGPAGNFKMTPVPRTVEQVQSNQFGGVTLEISTGSSAQSPLIFLDVQTDSNANSGNTEGWYYRMNFLYS